MHYDAIIIGAGMSGLAAGIRLAMYDKRVVVLERHYVWGGLNSFYQFQGHQFDVGLHAMTNYAPRGAKGLPLTRLLKQLRIRGVSEDSAPESVQYEQLIVNSGSHVGVKKRLVCEPLPPHNQGKPDPHRNRIIKDRRDEPLISRTNSEKSPCMCFV